MIKVCDWLYRGGRPCDTIDLQNLREAGINSIVNLQSGVHEIFHDDHYEKFSNKYGLKILKLYCSDIMPPDKKRVTNFLNFTTNTWNDKIYVHCLHGVDRTGFMCAVFRMQIEGWSYEKARDEMFSYGFHKWPYLWWTISLKKWESK